jgi:hypothetical protein
MQTPIDDFGIFIEVYIEKHSGLPLVLIGAPHKKALIRAKLSVG